MHPLSELGEMWNGMRQNVLFAGRPAGKAGCAAEKFVDFTVTKQTKQNEATRSKTNMILILFLILFLILILYYHHPMIIVPTLTRRRR